MKSNVLCAVVIIVCSCMMTSLAMTSNIFVKMISSSGAPVCSTETPSQVLSMHPKGVMMCGRKCSVSDRCRYFQLNSSSASSGQCQLYNMLPVNFTHIEKCVGFAYSLSCPAPWMRRGKRCYSLAVGQFQSRNQAEDYCSALNTSQQSHLINIESVDKQKLVKNLVSELIPGTTVDGNRDSYMGNGSCSHTNNDPAPWLAVDLGKPTDVYGVAVTNRDIAAVNFLVGLTNNPPNTMPPTTNAYTTCSQWPGSAPASATMFVECADNLPPARYVVIIQQYQPRGYLVICELEVFGKGVFTRHSVNLALNRPTWQSSNFDNNRYLSETAVDGNRDSYFGSGSCSHTSNDPAPWLAVDLSKPTDVYGVAVTNRDSCQEREDNFIVGLTNNTPSTMPPTSNSYTTCGQWPGSAPASATMFVKCADNLPPARYVAIIQQYQPRGNLQICELEVFGKGNSGQHNVNLALNRPTWQSSDYSNASVTTRYSWYAVDGITKSSFTDCACTSDADTSPWWAVDLGVMTHVYGAALTNRAEFAERADSFTVGLTNNPPSTMPPTTNTYITCGQWPGSAPASATMFVKCVDNLPPARYVVIIQQYQPRRWFAVCELEVYGKAFVWLNGRRPDPTSPFVWNPYQPTSMPLTYNNWAYGVPAVNSSCLAMAVSSGTWYDMQCISPKGAVVYAICETP